MISYVSLVNQRKQEENPMANSCDNFIFLCLITGREKERHPICATDSNVDPEKKTLMKNNLLIATHWFQKGYVPLFQIQSQIRSVEIHHIRII